MSAVSASRRPVSETIIPPGYQPGIGRSATPFTTRADLGGSGGNGRGSGKPDLFGPPPPGYVPGRGRGATGFAGGVSRDDTVDDRGDYSDTNYDEFSGYSEGLFRDGEYDEEDRQADCIYDDIDQRIDLRRRSRREARLKNELSKLRAEKPTVHQQFSDLKKALSAVSHEEWDSIPDIGDYTLKAKQKRPLTYTPTPDSLLLRAQKLSQSSTMVVDSPQDLGGGASTPIGLGLQTPLGMKTPFGVQTPIGLQTPLGLRTPFTGGTLARTTFGGFRTPMAGGGATPSLNDLGEARGTVLSVKLDKVMDNVSGQTVIDPKGYLTDLNSMPMSNDSHVADVKKARLLLRSVIQTNPSHAPGWIAAARLEELGGKLQSARDLIAQGCLHCQKNEDIWLEAARLERTPAEARTILARGIKEIPHSIRLWLEAANKEETKSKKLILRKALQFIPNSVRLWKEAISMEEPDSARIMLTRAVECVPQSVEMWSALAKLSPYQEAQKVLNEARKHIPTSVEIWINAAKLEETHGNFSIVETIISRAVEKLALKEACLDRDVWIKHAEDCEKSNYIKTCQALVKTTMLIGVETVNRAKIWMSDAESALSHGRIETARALYTNSLVHLRGYEPLWLALVDAEIRYGTSESLDLILRRAVEDCPASEALWLMAAKQKWLRRDINAARLILAEAFRNVNNKETVSLSAVKLERETGEYERARLLLDQARIRCNNSEKVWVQSVQLERMLENFARAKDLSRQALEIHPKSSTLWLIAGQLYLEQPQPDIKQAMQLFEKGRKHCIGCPLLWLATIDLYKQQKSWVRARALLEEARLKIPQNELLWLSAVHIERLAACVSDADWDSGNFSFDSGLQTAHHVMAKALQECPRSGILWAEAIFLEPKAAQNAKSADALTQCENEPNVILAIAKLFWRNDKIVKARRWLNRVVTLNPKLGDAWGAALRLEILYGKDPSRLEILKRCHKAEPKEGLQWNRIVKRPCNWRLSIPEKLRVFLENVYPECFVAERLKEPLGQDILDILKGKQSLATECKEEVATTVPAVVKEPVIKTEESKDNTKENITKSKEEMDDC